MKHTLTTHVALLFALLTTSALASATTQPNILLIISDDQGYADIGIQGCTDIETPNLDALARSGVRCTDAYVTAPVCSPSRAGLLAGRDQQRFGHYYNTSPRIGMPVDVVTIPMRLKKLGYTTAAFGKWHLGHKDEYYPTNRGFDHFYGFRGGGHGYFGGKMERNGEVIQETEYLTDAITRETIAFMNSVGDKPFFIYCAYNAPHTPLHAKPEHLEKYASIANEKRRAYAGMVHSMDENIGRLLQTLRDKGIEENTLVIFLSDNGGMPPNYSWSNNPPLKGGKGNTWEGGIRVPFFASWKGVLPTNTIHKGLVSSIDICTTAIAAAGGTVDPAWKLEGVDLLPLFKGETPPSQRALFWKWHEMWAVRQGDMKLVQMRDEPVPYLYDLSSDISETTDLTAEQPEVKARLRATWEQWDSGNIDPLWGKFGAKIEK